MIPEPSVPCGFEGTVVPCGFPASLRELCVPCGNCGFCPPLEPRVLSLEDFYCFVMSTLPPHLYLLAPLKKFLDATLGSKINLYFAN